jgi:hypothetical protein
MQTQALALFPSETEFNIMRQQAGIIVGSGFLPKAINTPEKALALMLKGRELGIPPMMSIEHIHIVDGKPGISAQLMLAQVFRIIPTAEVEFPVYTAERVVVKGRRNAKAGWTEVEWTLAQAKHLSGKDNWRNYPRSMLRSRAISELCKAIFPDAVAGMYTPEELGAANTDEDGVPINVTPAKHAALPAKTDRQDVWSEPAKPESSHDEAPADPEHVRKIVDAFGKRGFDQIHLLDMINKSDLAELTIADVKRLKAEYQTLVKQ